MWWPHVRQNVYSPHPLTFHSRGMDARHSPVALLILAATLFFGDLVAIRTFAQHNGINEDAPQDLIDAAKRFGAEELRRGQWQEAEKWYRAVLKHRPDDLDALRGISIALVALDQHREAIRILESALDRQPNNADIAFLLGRLYYQIKNRSRAMERLEVADNLEPNMPDVRFWLGRTYIDCGYPLLALDTMCDAATSSQNFEWAQDLAIGSAFGQLGLQSQASGYFNNVYNQARGTPFEVQADQLQRQMDNAVFGREYLRGSVKWTQRYDTNPSVLPILFLGSPLGLGRPGGANTVETNLHYDLVRRYNLDVTTGGTFYHSTNYNAHGFDVSSFSGYVSGVRRTYLRCTPVFFGLRGDYTYNWLGSDDFFYRIGLAPTITIQHTDDSWTGFLFRYHWTDFTSSLTEGTLTDLDAENVTIGAFRRRDLNCLPVTWSWGYRYDFNFSQGLFFDYSGHTIHYAIEWDTPVQDLKIQFRNEIYFRTYKTNIPIGRDDEEYLISLVATYPLYNDIFLSVAWNMDRNDSIRPGNDYRRHIVDFGIEYRFPNSYARRSFR